MRYTKLSEALKALRENQTYPCMGICSNIESIMNFDSYIFHDVPSVLKESFKEWPHFSGELSYPIPDTRKKPMIPSEMYRYAMERKHVWNKNTLYGKLRYDLLEHCIKYFEQRGM